MEHKDTQLFSRSLKLSIAKTMLIRLALSSLLVCFIVGLDHILMAHTKIAGFDTALYKDLLLGGMGIAGVILGLYCANIAYTHQCCQEKRTPSSKCGYLRSNRTLCWIWNHQRSCNTLGWIHFWQSLAPTCSKNIRKIPRKRSGGEEKRINPNHAICPGKKILVRWYHKQEFYANRLGDTSCACYGQRWMFPVWIPSIWA